MGTGTGIGVTYSVPDLPCIRFSCAAIKNLKTKTFAKKLGHVCNCKPASIVNL